MIRMKKKLFIICKATLQLQVIIDCMYFQQDGMTIRTVQKISRPDLFTYYLLYF